MPWRDPGPLLGQKIRESHSLAISPGFPGLSRNQVGAIPIRAACSRTQRKLQANTEGSVMVEYTVLLVLVAIGVSAAIYAIGMPLVQRYQFMKLLIGLPLP
jgi:Flp pilus assembly pilin Flp